MTRLGGGGPQSLKRFYREASVEARDGAFVILLDGKPAKTPKRAPLAAPTEALAEAVAAEWRDAGEAIGRDDLRLTRLVATAIDLGPDESPQWREDVVRYAGFDLLCYRAADPQSLVARQTAAWDPFLAFAREDLGAPFVATTGVVATAQPALAIDAIRRATAVLDPWRMLGLKTAAEITGSAILAFALERGFAPSADIFAAARVDEKHQIERWGRDAEAEARAERLAGDFAAAALFLRCVGY
ncbi:MAG: hypothetical protein K2Q06_01705 [Parvularculaceae bacterium]|nr:hypothetical protein [Parvularculaceae bacterium]